MITRFSLLALVVSSASIAQAQVSLAGTVADSRSGLAVVGATVKLQSLGLATTSDTGGRFALTGALGLDASRVVPLPDSRGLIFSQEKAGPVEIRVLDLSGAAQAVVHSGVLAAGNWKISPPDLGPGVFVCAIETPGARHSVRYLGSMRGGAASAPHSVGSLSPASEASARTAATGPVDTLLVAKGGYRTARVALSSYQQSDLAVVLEDTSTTNSDQATIVPDTSWPCYMPDGIPPPTLGTAAFGIVLRIGATHDVGVTQFGHRHQFDITGGSVTGSQFTGTVLTGGLDYELTLADGSVESEEIDILQAGSTPILMRNAGVAPAGGGNVREVLDFEAPNSSSYAWLNSGKYAAVRIVDTVAQTIRLDVYDISNVALPATRVRMSVPPVVHPSWNCATLTGNDGASVFTENVSLGSSITIGASKRGSRNIVPITGGTTTGRVVGKILDGGGDYQLTGLDARYTLATNDGEFIVVRNCGPANSLVPVFEARAEGPYAFLNQVQYFSSAPGAAGSGVSITFYQKQ